ncbi:MAG: hypothetical protein IKV00_04835 [Clostridia bacterium]|nr:hypothetical protein [Clostridia bacterium]
MKKLLAILLAAMMLLSFVACGETQETETDVNNETENNVPENETPDNDEIPSVELAYNSALELLQLVMNGYNATATEDTMLYVAGGNINNFETTNMEGPATFVALADDDYDANLGYPVADVAKIDDAASMFNMMNTNVFNCYAVHFTNSGDVDAMVEAIKNNILARQWICGSPEKLVIAKVPGDYLIVVWGAVQFGGIVDPFVASFATSVEGSSIVVEHTFEF